MTWFNVIFTDKAIEDVGIGATARADDRGIREILWNGMIMRGRDGLRKDMKDDTLEGFPELNMYIVDKGGDSDIIRLAEEYLKVSKDIRTIVLGMEGEIYRHLC